MATMNDETPDGGKRKRLRFSDKFGAVVKAIALAMLLTAFILFLIYLGVPHDAIPQILRAWPKF